MKSIFKISTGLFAAVLFSASMVSCSEDIMDGINADRNHMADAPAKYTLSGLIASAAWQINGGDLNTYTAAFVEHEAGVDNQLANAERRVGEPTAASTFNNSWGDLYSDLRDLYVILNDEEKSSDPLVKGIAEILMAYDAAILTDCFGDVPFSESFVLENQLPKFMQPNLDTQESVYQKIFAYLDDAIAVLSTKPANTMGDYDFFFNGQASSWVKVAYGLKARYTMRLIKRSSNVEQSMKDVLEYASKSYTSKDDEATFGPGVYNASNINPLFDFEWSRDGLAGSQSMFDKLSARHDPRIDRIYFAPSGTEENGVYVRKHIPAAEVELYENGVGFPEKGKYTYSVYMYAQTADTYLFSYHELLYLKAEALCRLNRASEAEAFLREATEVTFANTEASIASAITAPKVVNDAGLEDIRDGALTKADADNYFDTYLKPLFDANPLKETMIEKYIGMWGANSCSLETYNDIRRMMALGEDFVELKNPENAKGKFPLRFVYGSGDVTANKNVQAAAGNGQYVYSEPVWWAGGSR